MTRTRSEYRLSPVELTPEEALALVAIKRAADSNEPALSYAASYAVASVLATMAGQIVVLLML